MAVALVPIMALQIEQQRRLQRLETQRLAASETLDALALLQRINLAEQPTGTLPMGGDAVLRWRAAPLTPLNRTIAAEEGSSGDRLVALYRVKVEIAAQEKILAAFEVEQVGWRNPEEVQAAGEPSGVY